MHKDKNGNSLNTGDTVTLEAIIRQLAGTGELSQALIEATGKPVKPGDGPFQFWAYSSHLEATAPSALPDDVALEVEIMEDKQLRRRLDEHLQEAKMLPPSIERANAIMRLQEAIMWLGMDLKRLGTANPYPNSKDPSNTIVDPTADGLKL